MKNILYSILQYKHSLLKKEAFQIGIVFYFPYLENQIKFYYNAPDTLKTIYPDMDYSLLVHYLELIQINIELQKKLIPINELSLVDNLKLFLNKYILLEDSTVLQFQTPLVISNIDDLDIPNILQNYLKLLLSFQYNGEINTALNQIKPV